MENAELRGQSLKKGSAILLISGLIIKIIGVFFKVPLTNLIGGEGMAYFSFGFTIYVFISVLASAGLPAAVAKLVSSNNALGRYKEADRVIKVAFSTYSIVGLFGAIAVFFTADFIADTFWHDTNAALSIKMVAPAIFLISVVSVYKGYFQGHHNMYPTSASNTIEAVVQFAFGLGAAYLLSSSILQDGGYPVHVVAAGTISSVSLGTLLAMAYMLLKYKKRKRTVKFRDFNSSERIKSSKKLYSEFIRISVPITLSAIVLNLTNLIDMFLIKNRLLSLPNMTNDFANKIYGAFSSMSVTMFNMPAAIIMSIGVSALPIISTAYTMRNKEQTHRTINSALRLCSILAIPSGIGLSVMAFPILNLLFFARPVEVNIATPPLALLGIAVFTVSMSQLTSSMLQSVGKMRLPVYHMLIGGVIKVVTNYFLVGNPAIGINGAPIGTNLCYATIMILNFAALYRHLGVLPNLKTVFFKPLIASLGCGGAAYLSYFILKNFIGSKISTLVGIVIAVFVYFILLIITRSISKREIKMIPFSQNLSKILEKKGWIG